MEHQKRNYWIKDIVLESKTALSAIILFVICFITVVMFYKCLYFAASAQPTEYKGKVLDKWISVFETVQGSKISGKVLIEDENGKKINIQVSRQVFDKIEIGYKVENNGSELIILSEK